jgi:hypothetical protein
MSSSIDDINQYREDNLKRNQLMLDSLGFHQKKEQQKQQKFKHDNYNEKKAQRFKCEYCPWIPDSTCIKDYQRALNGHHGACVEYMNRNLKRMTRLDNSKVKNTSSKSENNKNDYYEEKSAYRSRFVSILI